MIDIMKPQFEKSGKICEPLTVYKPNNTSNASSANKTDKTVDRLRVEDRPVTTTKPRFEKAGQLYEPLTVYKPNKE